MPLEARVSSLPAFRRCIEESRVPRESFPDSVVSLEYSPSSHHHARHRFRKAISPRKVSVSVATSKQHSSRYASSRSGVQTAPRSCASGDAPKETPLAPRLPRLPYSAEWSTRSPGTFSAMRRTSPPKLPFLGAPLVFRQVRGPRNLPP